MHPHLRDEEALVVENAIRLAIDTVINVLYGVNSARTREYQRMVADRDKEIQRLECRLKQIEQDLQVPRTLGCTSGMLGKATGFGSQSALMVEQRGFTASCVDSDMTAEEQEYDMSISLDLFTRPPSHVSTQSHESALPSSPSRVGMDQSSTCHSSESSGVSETARNLPSSPSSLVIKQEPSDMDAVLVKCEMKEEGFGPQQESTRSPCQEKESAAVQKNMDDGERTTFREKAHTELDGHHISEGEQLRNKKKTVPMSELTEEAQRLKRAAWREASRRYYARKVARQQANPSHTCPFPNFSDCQYSQPVPLVDKRKKMPISHLPDESQTLQREAWRAASRRYYARKIARQQTESAQFVHLLRNIEPSAETLGRNGEESHSKSGGIMCS